jgi:hypothetical protein
MVGVAQLVELRIVTPAVEGSIPFVHPNLFSFILDYFASVVELVDTIGLGPVAARCGGSSPSRGTNFKGLLEII